MSHDKDNASSAISQIFANVKHPAAGFSVERASVIERAILDELGQCVASPGQLYFRLAARGLVSRERAAFGQHLTHMLLEGRLPPQRLLDGHQWARHPHAGSGDPSKLARHATHTEVWCACHGLMGVVASIAEPFGVPVVPVGYEPTPWHWQTLGRRVRQHRRPLRILSVAPLIAGRTCPMLSGATLAKRLLPGRDVSVEKIALTPEQKAFHRLGNLSKIEISPEAIPPHAFHVLLRSAIERRIAMGGRG